MSESGITTNDLGFEKYAQQTELDLTLYPRERIARVTEEHKTRWILGGDTGVLDASVRGALHYDLDAEAFPKVGDWVTYTPLGDGKAAIEKILPRVSRIARKNIRGQGMQIIVTNIDMVAIVQGADQEFTIPKLQRYVQLVRESGAAPIFVLTKIDSIGAAPDLATLIHAFGEIAQGIPVVALSSKTGQGMDDLASYFKSKETVVLLGSSGAGKSTLLNALIKKDIQVTQAVRADDGKGRHTTTRRSLFRLPSGALVIDTPGMRELMLMEEEKVKDVFSDVEEISHRCRFPNCDHVKSAECALQAAIQDGSLDSKRYTGYLKFMAQKKKSEVKPSGNQHSDRVKSNRAMLNYESRRQSEEE